MGTWEGGGGRGVESKLERIGRSCDAEEGEEKGSGGVDVALVPTKGALDGYTYGASAVQDNHSPPPPTGSLQSITQVL